MHTKGMIGIASTLLVSALAQAGAMGTQALPAPYHPVVSVIGGFSAVSTHNSQTFTGADDEAFLYHHQKNNHHQGLIGVFLGVEHSLPSPDFLLQLGGEYTYFGPAHAQGLNFVGIEPSTYTTYTYNYRLQSQQALAVAKVLKKIKPFVSKPYMFYPYASIGLGLAFNNSSDYGVSTQESGGVNLTPTFANQHNRAFSYRLGVGVDTDIAPHLRAGLGYRFADLGKASLGSGTIQFNGLAFPVPFSPHVPHVYANQLVAQISYVA
ncbi:MAG: outer membrane beta-barrel protein [bacterium]|nr:outer membrane beta-barrel protein [bacterium]